MQTMWFAAWECKIDGKLNKMSGVFGTNSDIPIEAYDEVKAAIMDIGGTITEVWIISFNRI